MSVQPQTCVLWWYSAITQQPMPSSHPEQHHGAVTSLPDRLSTVNSCIVTRTVRMAMPAGQWVFTEVFYQCSVSFSHSSCAQRRLEEKEGELFLWVGACPDSSRAKLMTTFVGKYPLPQAVVSQWLCAQLAEVLTTRCSCRGTTVPPGGLTRQHSPGRWDARRVFACVNTPSHYCTIAIYFVNK